MIHLRYLTKVKSETKKQVISNNQQKMMMVIW